MPVVEFQPPGIRVEVREGTTVLEAAQLVAGQVVRWGIRPSCGGQGRCGQCRVRIGAGRVSGADEDELELLARSRSGPGYRLACRARVLGDVTVELDRLCGGDRLQVAGAGADRVALEPVVRQVEFRLTPPQVGQREGEADRLAAAVGSQMGGCREPAGGATAGESWPPDVRCDTVVLRSLADALPDWGYRGWAVVRGGEIVALHRKPTPLLGLAVDLGTTKVAGYLVDLGTGEILHAAARLNPQIAYGEDVVSRLGYAAAAPENYRRIREAIIEGLNDLARELCGRMGREATEIQEAVVCGNTAMHHLFLGLGVSQLARAPYVPALTGPLEVKARDLGMYLAPGAYVYLMPCVAGYVGGDHVAVLLSTGLGEQRGVALAIDVGTNTEIALARDGVVTSCSCASGPAFEGGHVSRGMRALAGAIDRVWLQGEEIRFSVVGGGEPVGFCGAGLIDVLAVLLKKGIMDGSGRLKRGQPGVVEGPGGLEFRLGGISLTQQDIRQLQLAKAAVRSGIEGLLRTTGTGVEEVRVVYLAGAFGTGIDPESAMATGMFPRLPPERFVRAGNAAGMGAYLALVSQGKRREAASLARSVRYLELLTLPGYQDLFLSCLSFPG